MCGGISPFSSPDETETSRKTVASSVKYQSCCKSGTRQYCNSWICVHALICLEPDGSSAWVPIRVLIVLDLIFSLSLLQISPSAIYTYFIYFSSWLFSVCLFCPSTSRKEQEYVSWFITGLIFLRLQFSTISSISFMFYRRYFVLGAFP